MRNMVMAAMLAVSLPAMAVAAGEAVDGKTAKKMLFSPRGVDLVVLPDSGLDAIQQATVLAILKGIKPDGLTNYYGAVAASPDFFAMMAEDAGQATLSGLFQLTGKLHSPGAAAALALAACTAARKSDNAPCVLAARILPRKWAARELMLSVDATQAFKAYRRGSGPKAMAASASTFAFAIIKGDGAAAAALAQCNRSAAVTGSPDCEVVIAD